MNVTSRPGGKGVWTLIGNVPAHGLDFTRKLHHKTRKLHQVPQEGIHLMQLCGVTFNPAFFIFHLEVASDSFCFLINSSWLLVFILFLFLHALGLNLYWWKGIHFS